ncbi:MAG: metal ABC transporter permease [Promethearchaeota archaeon]
MASIADFFNSLSELYNLRPLLTALFIGVLCAVIGVFIILRGLVFFGNGIAHSAFAGGALGLLLGMESIILLPISVFAIITALTIGYINEQGKLNNETAIGIIFSFVMALGIIFISIIGYNNNVGALLFGSLTLVSGSEFYTIIILGILVLTTTWYIEKELFFVTFDEDLAKANGMPVRFLNYLFLILVAITIIVCITTIGMILVMALIVTPAAAAYQFSYKVKNIIIYSIILSQIGAFFGFMFAYIWNVQASAMIVLILTTIFFISMVVSPKRRFKKSVLENNICPTCQHALETAPPCEYCLDEGLTEYEHEHEHEHEHDHENEHAHEHA